MKRLQKKPLKKQVKRNLIISAIVMLLVLVTVFIGASQIKKAIRSTPKAAANNLRPIKGTFFMADLPYNSDAEMEPYFKDMQATGLDTLIFAAIGGLQRATCTDNPSGAYVEGSSLDGNSQYRMAMRLAKKYGFKIYMGTVQPVHPCIKMWSGSATDPNTDKGRLIDYNARALANLEQIFKQEGWNFNDNSFLQGFYISAEKDITVSNDAPVFDYFVHLSRSVKTKYPTKKIMISPWVYESTTYDQAKRGYLDIFQKTAIDIIAPQDSMGTFKTTSFARDADHFRALRDAAQAIPGKEGWANIESFKNKPDGASYTPADFATLYRQIETVRPYVSNYITWIHQHTLAAEPRLTGTKPWSNAYGYEDSVRRLDLRARYDEAYGTGTLRVVDSFMYGDNWVLKGPAIGTVGQSLTFQMSYISKLDNKMYTKTVNGTVRADGDKQVVYISLTSLPGINTSKPVAVVIANAPSIPTVTNPATTPAPTSASSGAINPVVKYVFFYGDNVIVKGTGFGNSSASVRIDYKGLVYQRNQLGYNWPRQACF